MAVNDPTNSFLYRLGQGARDIAPELNPARWDTNFLNYARGLPSAVARGARSFSDQLGGGFYNRSFEPAASSYANLKSGITGVPLPDDSNKVTGKLSPSGARANAFIDSARARINGIADSALHPFRAPSGSVLSAPDMLTSPLPTRQSETSNPSYTEQYLPGHNARVAAAQNSLKPAQAQQQSGAQGPPSSAAPYGAPGYIDSSGFHPINAPLSFSGPGTVAANTAAFTPKGGSGSIESRDAERDARFGEGARTPSDYNALPAIVKLRANAAQAAMLNAPQ